MLTCACSLARSHTHRASPIINKKYFPNRRYNTCDDTCACDPRSICDTARSMLDSTVIYIDRFITAYAEPFETKIQIYTWMLWHGKVWCTAWRKSTKGRRTMTCVQQILIVTSKIFTSKNNTDTVIVVKNADCAMYIGLLTFACIIIEYQLFVVIVIFFACIYWFRCELI